MKIFVVFKKDMIDKSVEVVKAFKTSDEALHYCILMNIEDDDFIYSFQSVLVEKFKWL